MRHMSSAISFLRILLTCKVFLASAFILLLFSPLYAQTPEEVEEVEAEIEEPKPIMNIDVKDRMLSVELLDAEIGDVIDNIAEKVGFQAEISVEVNHKKISTTFKDVEIEKGIRRLLTLIKENDYTLYYTPDGLISKIDIYGGSKPGMKNTTPPQRFRQSGTVTTTPLPMPTMPRLYQPSGPAVQVPSQQQPKVNIPPQFKAVAPPATPKPPQPAASEED
ncbi:MAG: hypothetical protein HY755_05650 [Nitrospirae bacterium]|nr:hypothetical protein [Nitrospirota bacterium]